MENRDATDETPFLRLIKTIASRLLDLSGQLNNLVVLYRNLSAQGTDEFTIRALKTAVVSVSHQFLETTLASLASITLQMDAQMDGTPSLVRNLKDYERDYLAEEETTYDGESGKASVRERQMAIVRRLYGIPALYASVFGVSCKLDKTCAEWRWLKEFIDIRNRITHPRLGDVKDERLVFLDPSTREAQPTFTITEVNLWKGMYAILWYLVSVTRVLTFPFENIDLPEGMATADVLTTDPNKLKELPTARILLQLTTLQATGFCIAMALNTLKWTGPGKQPDLGFFWSICKMANLPEETNRDTKGQNVTSG
jgi:hypothetical protein